ncbi:MAG: 16S rRNA (guanine(966)-N(2))-methyltransferase RsmD [Gammaproteobacteria bacterium]|nr:MAG: 16S rRNA (guanine(966)-N(2))-methyltransferase RsmD [Gammaproteobacteria bacterium]
MVRKNALRVIGGRFRGRIIRFHDAPGLRPTPNRVRETVFNWLRPDLPGARCLDLFAGSGALGIEALSQGAREVTLVEANRRAAASILATLTSFGAIDAQVINDKAGRFLKQTAKPFDIVFLDPPFHKNLIEPVCAELDAKGWLKPGALVYIEAEQRIQSGELPENWRLLKNKTTGEVVYHLFQAHAR